LANSPPLRRLTGLFPYLAIPAPRTLLGFELRPASPAPPAGESGEPAHVAAILSMFFDGDGGPIHRATYFEAEVDCGAEDVFVDELDRLIAALGFLLFDPDHPATSLDGNFLRLWMFEPAEAGFTATTNMKEYADAVPGQQRFYPGVPDLVPHYERIHHEDLSYRLLDDRHWPGPERRRVLDRLLLSMFWYGRSFGVEPHHEERMAIVNLATAFEVLFEVGDATGKRRQILDSLEEMFGVSGLLADWVRQFYDTRSNVIHEGRAVDLLFQHQGAGRPHRNLVSSGQRLYRAAAEAYLHRHAHQPPKERPRTASHHEAFLLDMIPNEARLESMAKSRPGRQRLRLLELAGDLRFDDGTGRLPIAIRAGRKLLNSTRKLLDGNGLKEHRLEVELQREPAGLKRAYARLGAGLRRAIRIPAPGAPAGPGSDWKTARSLRHFAAWIVWTADYLEP
jgi:hypothetical protein